MIHIANDGPSQYPTWNCLRRSAVIENATVIYTALLNTLLRFLKPHNLHKQIRTMLEKLDQTASLAFTQAVRKLLVFFKSNKSTF